MLTSFSHPATKQDIWVANRLEGKHDGFFVEVGADDGLRYSNTLLLERHFGWTGLLIEPNPANFLKVQANRPNCKFSHDVIDKDASYRLFIDGGPYSGLMEYMPYDWQREHKKRNNTASMTTTRPLASVLIEHNCPSYIDYLSLDVEGAELPILKGFIEQHQSRHTIGIMSVEFRYDMLLLAELEDVLEDYHLEHVEGFDAFFVHRSLKPVQSIALARAA